MRSDKRTARSFVPEPAASPHTAASVLSEAGIWAIECDTTKARATTTVESTLKAEDEEERAIITRAAGEEQEKNGPMRTDAAGTRSGGFLTSGVRVFRYFAISLFRCFGVSVFRCFGVLVFRCFGVSVFRVFGVSGFRCFGVSGFRVFAALTRLPSSPNDINNTIA